MTLAFFRRHRKWFMILMILGVISMVFFQSWDYLPKLMEWLGAGPGSEPVGSIAGRQVTHNEVVDFYQKVSLAGEASQWWAVVLDEEIKDPAARVKLYRLTMGATAWPVLIQALAGEKPKLSTIMTWLALYDEARARGFEMSDAAVAARLKGLEELGLGADAVNRLVQRAGGNRDHLFAALRTDMTVRLYIDWLRDTLSASVGPEVRREFTKTDDRIQVRLAVLKAAAFLSEVKEVPEAALNEQFTKYRAFLAGQGSEGYGYRIPDKVAIEYLVADPKAFEPQAAAKITDADIQKYYDVHKASEYLVPSPPKADEKKAEEKPAEKKFRPLSEVRDEVRQAVIREEASALALERLHTVVAEFRRIRTPPPIDRWADGAFVRHVSAAGLRTQAELADLSGIGKAARGKTAMAGNGKAARDQTTMAEEAMALPQLVGQAKAKIGVGELSEPMAGPDGKAYAFRVTHFEKNHEPAAIQEVRDQVLADVRRQEALNLARQEGRKLFDLAATKGLEEAAKAEKVGVVTSGWVPQERIIPIPYAGQFLTIPSALPEIGANRQVISECFRMLAEEKRLAMVTVAEQEMVVVAELAGHRGPREALWQTMRPMLADMVSMRLGGEALRQVINLDAVRQRMAIILDVEDEFRMPRGARGYEESDEGF
jgi:hypothetical protein